jgi:CubicO group peptidase (beta-lactamase class C family)
MNRQSDGWFKRFTARAAAWTIVMAVAILTSAQAKPEIASYQGLPANEFMKSWLVLGAIPVAQEKEPDDEIQKKAFASDFLADQGGETGVQPQPGLTHKIFGKDYQWKSFQSDHDTVDLVEPYGKEEFVVAYAWAEIVVPEAQKLLFGIGSDDGVKVWLNGKLIHENWTSRAVRKDDDLVSADLKRGKNQLLLKVQNGRGAWGFACRVLGPEALTEKLVRAAGAGDLDAIKQVLAHGGNVNAKLKFGLTALHAAHIHGWNEVADFLRSQGADPKVAIPPVDVLIDGMFQDPIKGLSPGAAVLVAQNGKILFQKGYGYANLEHRVPITPETKFRIGSITKQFTAAAILKLQEQGKLSVKDTLSKYIPDFPRGEEVTIHHLLTHTSGIHSYTNKPDFMETAPLFIKPDDLIKSFKNDPYDFAPGKKWSYNNSGYFLLGYIIEKVSGQSYAEYLKKQFFEPLGMANTGVHHWNDILEHEAHGYSYEGGKFKKAKNWDMSRAGAAGALYSTVADLYRWNEAVFSGKVLSDASLKAAFTPVMTEADAKVSGNSVAKEEGYGYGWGIGKDRGLQEIAHGGGLNGFSSNLLRYPKENFTVVVLANAAPLPPGLNPGGLSQEIAAIYLSNKMEAHPILQANAAVSPKVYDAYVGRYDYGGPILTVTRQGDRLFTQLAGQPKFEIFPKSETEFFWKVVEAQVTFVKNEKGEVTGAVHRQGGQTIHAPRLEKETLVKVDPALFDAYVGKYDFGNGKTVLTVTKEGDRLLAQLTGQPQFEIFPKSETEFFWRVVQAHIVFVKDEKGKVAKGIFQQGGQTIEAPKVE